MHHLPRTALLSAGERDVVGLEKRLDSNASRMNQRFSRQTLTLWGGFCVSSNGPCGSSDDARPKEISLGHVLAIITVV